MQTYRDSGITYVLIHIDPFGENAEWQRIIMSASIHISKRHDWNRVMRWEAATINWSAIGAVDAEQAQLFAQALEWAVTEAQRLDVEFPPGAVVEMPKQEQP